MRYASRMIERRDEDMDADRLVDALVQAAFDVMGVLTRVAAENDLSLTQLRVLAILRDRRPTLSELAAHLGLDRSSISGLIDRAVQRGLVVRTRDEEDRRSSRVALTDAGRRLAAAGAETIRAGIEPLLAGLAARDRDRLAGLLESLLARS